MIDRRIDCDNVDDEKNTAQQPRHHVEVSQRKKQLRLVEHDRLHLPRTRPILPKTHGMAVIMILCLALFLACGVVAQQDNTTLNTTMNGTVVNSTANDDAFWVSNSTVEDGDNDMSSSSVEDDDTDGGSVEIIICQGCNAPDAILYPWFVQLMGCVVLFLLTRFNIPIPYAAVMFILGAAMGAGSSLTGDTSNALSRSITQWINIDSGLLLLVFLPGLIFKDAVTIPIHLFLVAFWQIQIFAFPMVLMGTALTALVGYYVLPYDWPLSAAATLGAILASTDPIAVASVLKTAGASPRLVMHISGESLLNDGSSFVFFTIFSQMYFTEAGIADGDKDAEPMNFVNGLLLFMRMSFGGTVVGAVFGGALLAVLWELDRRLEREFDIVQVIIGLTTAYLCYFVCDQLWGMSGIVAVVTLGVMVNYFGRSMINDKELMDSYLMLAEYLLNTLLFTLGGTIWAAISFEDVSSYQIQLIDWAWLVVLNILVLLIRFFQVGFFYPVFSRIGLKSDWREGVFLAYGGLRGAVGVALGLSLIRYVFERTADPDIRKLTTLLHFMGGGVTLLTLTINGTSAGPILKYLGLAKPAESSDRVKLLFEGMAMDFVFEQISLLFEEARFQHVNFNVLKKLVPFVTTEPHRGDLDNIAITRRDSTAVLSYATQRFNRTVDSGADQYLQVIRMTRRASERPPGYDDDEKEAILVEMRGIFLELLREAYNLLLELGELDTQDDNGLLYETLLSSVNLAKNEVEHNNSRIEDWKWTEKFGFMEATPKGAEHLQEPILATFLFSSILSDHSDAPAARKQINARRIRLDVLRSIAFQQGHRMARAKLDMYNNRIEVSQGDSKNDSIRPVLQKVKQESLDQVAIAREMIENEICDRDLEVIMSHYCARILIRRLMKFTEQKAEDGVLGKIEARKYLRDMKHRLRTIVRESIESLTNAECLDAVPKPAQGSANSAILEGRSDDEPDEIEKSRHDSAILKDRSNEDGKNEKGSGDSAIMEDPMKKTNGKIDDKTLDTN